MCNDQGDNDSSEHAAHPTPTIAPVRSPTTGTIGLRLEQLTYPTQNLQIHNQTPPRSPTPTSSPHSPSPAPPTPPTRTAASSRPCSPPEASGAASTRRSPSPRSGARRCRTTCTTRRPSCTPTRRVWAAGRWEGARAGRAPRRGRSRRRRRLRGGRRRMGKGRRCRRCTVCDRVRGVLHQE